MKFEEIFDNQDTNISHLFEGEKLKIIADQVVQGYDEDKQSRKAWEDQMSDALKIAMQVNEAKSFPWEGAANVKHPLLTLACVQYNARSYAAMIPGKDVARMRRRTEENRLEVENIEEDFNWKVTEEVKDWEEGQDKLLMLQPLVGCPFKKVYYSEDKVYSDVVSPNDIVIDYYAKSLEEAERITHLLYYYKNEIEGEIRSGFFAEEDVQEFREESQMQDVEDKAHGQTRPPSLPYIVLEQHCWLDLDEDGYAEPYVVWVDMGSQKVLRLQTRFESIRMTKDGNHLKGYDKDAEALGYEISRIVPEQYFVKYGFIPSPDGSIYDIGYGSILEPITRSANTVLNQLIDAGTLANAQGGLVSRNVRTPSGEVEISPGEFVRTEASSDELAKGVFPWPIKEPSNVMFALLGLLLESGQKVGSVTDLMTGESPGQNQPATTTMALMEQGMMVYSAIHKRTWRAQKQEFKLLYKLFSKLDEKTYTLDANEVIPVADPNVISQAQRLLKAEALMARVMQAPHLYGIEGALEAEKRYHKALQIENSDELMPNPQAPTNPEAEIEAQKAQDESQRGWASLEIQAQRTHANALKDMASIETKFRDADRKDAELDFKEYEAELKNETERLKVIMDRAREKSGVEGRRGNGKVRDRT